MNKINLTICFVLIVILAQAGIHPLYAATASPSASVTPTFIITPSESQNIQEKIKTMVKENIGSTEATLREKINLQTLVGYVGNIKSINSGNITLDSKDGTLLQITTNEKTAYIKAGVASKLSAIALSDKIIVIGTLIKDDIIMAKRVIVVAPDPNPLLSGTIVAKISSVDIKKKTVSLNVNNQEVLYTLTKKSTIKLDTLKAGETIFAITKKYDGKDFLSRAKIL